MKLLEYEAKDIFKKYGIPVAKGFVVKKTDCDGTGGKINSGIKECELGDEVVIKAQVEVGGRGKAGGVVICPAGDAPEKAAAMFAKDIKGVLVDTILVEEKLPITGEYYVSITLDRSKKAPVILFSAEGGVEIEETAKNNPGALHRVRVSPMLDDIPDFMMRELVRDAPKELAPVIKSLYRVFCKSDAILAEINPLVTTGKGVYAADAKIIVDDNALGRQGITVNRDLTERERLAEDLGFSYVELEGNIGVIGNGAGLTMSTLDMIEYFGGKAANFLDVGGGADRGRVCSAVKLVSGMDGVKVIVVNLLGGITRCDEVAAGIVEAGVSQQVVVRLAGTNEAEGKKILSEKGYRMLGSMEEVVKFAVEEAD
ncbi:succinyl-CoA synthetase, beta subunit [Methanolacinia petrolearia DSM 11571]|uniref:Succinyl-CoA synthetase, beta subunit n=1 Tax=Methanolacinia petrolearia (strain DSM 11571 / OCM 486 / SEBR 4847) TaxID=679926 RepID=E1RKS9_METP4|nr:ATP-grasp domain-containing protein [Methanolacinia petrolearia]ADN37018.1 succinyl-CoA synthetase, beta subunit [Methanolacinia petrolearia DSM 11571]